MTWQELLMRTGGSESSQVAAPPSTRQSSADLQPLLPSHDASGGTGQTRAEGGATQAPQPTVTGEARRSLSASSAVRPAYVQTANLAQPTPPSSKRPPPLPSAALRAGRASSPGLPRASILGAMLLDRSGGVLVQQGETARLDGKAHGLQTALDKLGEALGLNAFSAFECSLPGRKLMLFRNATGATVAVETPAGADLHEVREALERS